jgi:hypothetical protein
MLSRMFNENINTRFNLFLKLLFPLLSIEPHPPKIRLRLGLEYASQDIRELSKPLYPQVLTLVSGSDFSLLLLHDFLFLIPDNVRLKVLLP